MSKTTGQPLTYLDFTYQTSMGSPARNSTRVFADNLGRFAYKRSDGVIIALDTTNIRESTLIRLPNSTAPIVSTDSAAELTNKTINSTGNTITVGGTNINSLVNQDVRTTAAPTFTGMSLTDVSIDNSLDTVLCVDGDGMVKIRNNITESSGGAITGKIIDSADNTIRVNGTNINTLVGQDTRTTAAPTFAAETLNGRLTINTALTHPITINQSSGGPSNDLLFHVGASDILTVGTSETTSETYTWTHAARDYKIGTNNTERLRIASGGIALDNTATQYLALQGTTLVRRNDSVDLNSAQTLTNKTLTSPIISTIVNTGTLTLPTATTTLVGRDTVDTLSNKTFTSLSVTSLDSGGQTITLPTATTTLVGRDTVDTLSNKSFEASSCQFVDDADDSKQVAFDVSGAATSTTTTFATEQTVDRLITFPDVDDTVVTLGATQTLTGKTLTSPTINSPVLTNGGTITLPTATTTLVGRDTTDTLTNKTLTSPVITNSGNTITLPTVTATLVGRDTTDVLTNKTLTSPVLTTPLFSTITNTGTITLPTATTTLVGRDTTDTLTNKSLVAASCAIVDATDNNKRVMFNNAGAGAGRTMTFTMSPTSTDKTITFPDTTDTVVTLAAAQTLTGKTIASPVITNSGNTITLPAVTATLVGRDTTDVLTNKTLTSPVITTPTISSIVNTGTLTLPTATTTLVGRDTTDVLTNKTLTTPTINSPVLTNSGNTITLPTVTATLVGRDTVETLTNKTLTSPVLTTPTISSIVNTGTITLPTATTTLVGRDTTDVLTNKSLVAANCAIVDATDNNKRVVFNNAGAGAGRTMTFTMSPTSTDKTITFPDTTDTVVTLAATQTLTGKTLTSPVLTTPSFSTITNTGTITLPTVTATLVGRDTTDVLTNKTINTASGNVIQIAGTAITALVNQDVRTTASPTFSALNLTNGISAFGGNIYEAAGSNTIAAGGANVIVASILTLSFKSYLIEMASAGVSTSGVNVGKGLFQRSVSGATNLAGTITINNLFGNQFALNGILAGPGHNVSASGITVNVSLVGNATDALRFRWWVKIYIN